jgi:hypothetical protein
MYKRDVSRLVRIGVVIQSYFHNVVSEMAPKAMLAPQTVSDFTAQIEKILSECESLALPKTHALLRSVICDYRAVGHTFAQLKSTVMCINGQFEEELQERLFVQIDPGRESYLMTEEEFAEHPLFGVDVANAFASTNVDARNAGNSYASFRHTACVFHCMRVLEKGLIALAHELQVPFTMPFEYENWQNIIEPIEKAIRNFETNQKKSPHKVETLKVYSEIASQFFYVKAAWRNHVAHSRDTYDSEQAKTILDHTGDFMRHLVKAGLHE